MPIVEGVTAHSIIAVEGDGDPEDGADGIVMYKSAHIDGVASEKIVRSSHSTQGHPETIREIKRILFEQLGAIDEQERAKEPGIQATGARLKAMPSSGF
jgi:tyrosine-protein phosphatase YwqE